MTSCCVNKPFAVHTAASTDFHWLSPVHALVFRNFDIWLLISVGIIIQCMHWFFATLTFDLGWNHFTYKRASVCELIVSHTYVQKKIRGTSCSTTTTLSCSGQRSTGLDLASGFSSSISGADPRTSTCSAASTCSARRSLCKSWSHGPFRSTVAR